MKTANLLAIKTEGKPLCLPSVFFFDVQNLNKTLKNYNNCKNVYQSLALKLQ